LREELGEIGAGSQRRRRQAEVNGSEGAVMGVERLVPRVADQRPGNCGQVYAAIPRQNQIRNENVGEAGAIEVIAQLNAGVAISTDDALQLE
jgi:hypothetical protein